MNFVFAVILSPLVVATLQNPATLPILCLVGIIFIVNFAVLYFAPTIVLNDEQLIYRSVRTRAIPYSNIRQISIHPSDRETTLSIIEVAPTGKKPVSFLIRYFAIKDVAILVNSTLSKNPEISTDQYVGEVIRNNPDSANAAKALGLPAITASKRLAWLFVVLTAGIILLPALLKLAAQFLKIPD